ncbi:MAG TPA: NAD(P)H-dependent glycerol-3-phosphate dehydrogenase [Burkholderiaceae bacterium]|nr:NAD(P)H-dependent glycerol-3-phosphate dehydrogenase [Burkholderiaceae bacterium]
MRVTVFGAGAWGTALAASIAARNDVLLWARSPAQCAQLRAEGANRRYLDGVALPGTLGITSDFDAAFVHAQAGLAIIATPVAALAEMLRRITRAGDAAPGVLWLCKGLDLPGARLPHEVAAAVAPGLRVGVVSGPSFAIEVARGQPSALVVASSDAALCDAAVAALHGDAMRVYTSDDAIGVEVGGAVKNVMAIATGIADGLALGLNARAALITRGLAEMTRLGVALGARAETFMGLSGLGDLVLTATGDLSRNRQVGLMLARGLALPAILEQLGHVAEGVLCATAVNARALALGVEMPITEAVVQVLEGQATPVQALAQLMGRSARAEG